MEVNKSRTQIIAHRGGAAEGPENTLAAIRQALALGVQGVEIDAMESADGEVMVFHDIDLLRLGGSPLKVYETTAEELRSVDIGSHAGDRYASERIPLLSEVLEEVRGRARLMIELKYLGHDVALAQRVADVVAAHDMVHEVSVMSLHHPAVAELRSLDLPWRIGLVSAEDIADPGAADVDFLAMKLQSTTQRLVDQAHAAGIGVSVWTVNDAESMRAMQALGVDGIITDHPTLAFQVLTPTHGA